MIPALGVALGACHPKYFDAVVDAAEALGYESVWLPEHLVFPIEMSRSPFAGEEHPPIPPTTPVFDVFAYLAYVAGRTTHVRLGTHVYNLGLRHPFISARGAATVDIVSGGRFEFGIGASWLEQEWVAAQLDFASRGRRVDECLDVCRRLWTEAEVAHSGEFFEFGPVAFEPKPVQSPHPPVLVGGESPAALRRAAERGDGWLGMGHTVESVAERVRSLRDRLEALDRDPGGFQICVGGPVSSLADLEAWGDAGVTRLVISPWRRSREAVDGLADLAARVGLAPRERG